MADKFSFLSTASFEDLVTAAVGEIRKTDAKNRHERKVPLRRSPQEATEYRHIFDDALELFAFRLAKLRKDGHLVRAPQGTNLDQDLAESPNLFGLAYSAFAIPSAICLEVQERSLAPQKPTDLGNVSLLIATKAAADREVIKVSLEALLAVEFAEISLSDFGALTGVLLLALLVEPDGSLDRERAFALASDSQGKVQRLQYLVLKNYTNTRGLPFRPQL